MGGKRLYKNEQTSLANYLLLPKNKELFPLSSEF